MVRRNDEGEAQRRRWTFYEAIKEINENIFIDLDASGNLVAMTIEHARQQADLPSLSYEQIEKEIPSKLLQRTR